MKKQPKTRLKEWIAFSLDPSAGTGLLTSEEHRTIHALLQVLAWDRAVDCGGCRRYVDSRTLAEPGLLREYSEAAALLARRTRRLVGDRPFGVLTLEERDRVLGSLLRRYPHEERQSRWRRLTRLTDENLDAFFAPRHSRRFRVHVVRDLLKMYYTSAAGWAVVGYQGDFMGRVKAESDPCQVLSLRVEGDEVILHLSDATFEELDPKGLEVDEEHGFSVRTKAGRQRATFSKAAYYALAERIEEREGSHVLKLGDRAVPVFEGGHDI